MKKLAGHLLNLWFRRNSPFAPPSTSSAEEGPKETQRDLSWPIVPKAPTNHSCRVADPDGPLQNRPSWPSLKKGKVATGRHGLLTGFQSHPHSFGRELNLGRSQLWAVLESCGFVSLCEFLLMSWSHEMCLWWSFSSSLRWNCSPKTIFLRREGKWVRTIQIFATKKETSLFLSHQSTPKDMAFRPQQKT